MLNTAFDVSILQQFESYSVDLRISCALVQIDWVDLLAVESKNFNNSVALLLLFFHLVNTFASVVAIDCEVSSDGL